MLDLTRLYKINTGKCTLIIFPIAYQQINDEVCFTYYRVDSRNMIPQFTEDELSIRRFEIWIKLFI